MRRQRIKGSRGVPGSRVIVLTTSPGGRDRWSSSPRRQGRLCGRIGRIGEPVVGSAAHVALLELQGD
ncbi:hypothetical protein ASC61_08820 [Aeromicrobium sp. Root344]|nr:hypothetical protein ASC61_08820 [Aeromicrobium sp. Root344]